MKLIDAAGREHHAVAPPEAAPRIVSLAPTHLIVNID
jgi:hypothetical protein